MNTNQTEKGFTIIEVVLVLAIAGLIFLMVFIALPALQRGQRDAQRKSDVSRVNTQISNAAAANRGNIPPANGTDATGMIRASTGFVARYLGGASATAGDEYLDPKTGEGYVFTVDTGDPEEGEINYQTGVLCGADGATTNTGASGRNYVLRVKLENQTSPYCIDNR